MVVLPPTGASHYHNCCIYGGTGPENFGYHLILEKHCFEMIIIKLTDKLITSPTVDSVYLKSYTLET
jgi:hypothetical protein